MFGNIFNIFSRREPLGEQEKILTSEFRNRFLLLFRDFTESHWEECLNELHQKLSYLLGSPVLTKGGDKKGIIKDVLAFLNECPDENFIDSVEYFFQLNCNRISGRDEKLIIKRINEFFDVDSLPFQITESVWEETDHSGSIGPYGLTTSYTKVSHPQVIRRDSEPLYEFSLKPALDLLRQNKFSNPNQEFLGALEDYKNENYRDCVVKCSSSLESVMKILLSDNGIPYGERENFSQLLGKVVNHSSLDSFWNGPIMIVGTIRNRLGSSHGAGTQSRNVYPHVAEFSVNSTASIILLLTKEFG